MKKKAYGTFPRRAAAAALILLLLLTFLPAGALAAEEGHITVQQPESSQGTAGGLYQIALSDIFRDTEGHALTYGFESEQELSEHTKLDGSSLFFTPPTAGDYDITLKAACGTDRASCTIHYHIEAPADGLPIQYNYDQTPQESVQVYVTISSDGIPLTGKDEDNTLLCHLPVTVPYFDLGNYGLEDFYRYSTDSNGGYNGSSVIERPTALHLYLYLLERFALGYPEEECGTGLHNPLTESFGQGTVFENMWGMKAYSAEHLPLNITGSSTSMYMQQFWGHDENLMYYRNHVYPLQRAGWGSTADYILLSDGDTIDLAMFTNWDFYTHGAFLCFGDDGQACNTYCLPSPGENGVSLTTSLLKFGTQMGAEGSAGTFQPETGADKEVFIIPYTDGVWDTNHPGTAVTNEDGSFTAVFPADGLYQLLYLDPEAGTNDACLAPATAYVRVGSSPDDISGPDVNGDGSFDLKDISLAFHLCIDTDGGTPEQRLLADYNGDGRITLRDISLLFRKYQEADRA